MLDQKNASAAIHCFLCCPTLLIEERPIKDKVLLKVAVQKVLEQASQIRIIWGFLKFEMAAIVEVCCEFTREMLAENLNWRCHFFHHDLRILLLLVWSRESLPWQTTDVKVHHHIPDSLQIVAPALFNAQVCVDTGVTRCASQIFALTVGNMLLRLWVPVLFCQAKVDDVHHVCLLSKTNEEVVRLDVTVDEVLGMQVFNAIDHLVCKHDHSLEAEFAIAEAKQIFKGRAQKVNDHHVVIALYSVPMQVGHSNATCKDFVEFR